MEQTHTIYEVIRYWKQNPEVADQTSSASAEGMLINASDVLKQTMHTKPLLENLEDTKLVGYLGVDRMIILR